MTNSALRAFPRLAAASVELDGGRFDSAAAITIQHLRENRNEPRGVALLGRIALRTGALVQAEQFLRQAISLGLMGLEAKRDLAEVLYRQDRLGEAVIALAFLETQLTDPQISSTKGTALEKLGRHVEALEVRKRLVEEDAGNSSHLITLGHSFRALGRTDDAIGAYRRATQVDPERGEAWWGLASIKAKILNDADIEVLRSQLSHAIDLLNLVPLHFALGRAYHDQHEHKAAFEHYSTANKLSHDAMRYRADDLTEEVAAYVQGYGGDFFHDTLSSPLPGPSPIFVVSMPRAGSTLLEQMLDCHPAIEALGELPYVRALIRSALELHVREGAVKVPGLIKRIGDKEAMEFGKDYMRRAALHRRRETPLTLDKMPMNWSDLPFIKRILPNAKFIEIRRGAMDCCFSNFVHYFSRAHASSFDQADIGKSYVDYVRLMDHFRRVSPGLLCSIRYEELIENPKRELTKVLDYLGLEWDEALLRFYESDRSVRTPSAEQVRRPLNRSGIGTWKPYAEWLGPLREALGPLANA